MKTLLLIAAIIISSLNVRAQEYFNFEGMDKFAAVWEFANGPDTIRLYCSVRYVGSDLKIKSALLYYTYKQGNTIIWDNFSNANNDDRADFGGTRPYGPNKDSLVIMGRDQLKRKRDEGYIVINAAGTQLKFVRDIGITGGGISHSAAGQGPLPGYTLPSPIIFIKGVLPSEDRGAGKQKRGAGKN
ncbi:MAG TPA: hypothetical protein VK489_05135 [Ferruginibacter sp.]|nr:hypothetical protein [Ferruginibacter sp.]